MQDVGEDSLETVIPEFHWPESQGETDKEDGQVLEKRLDPAAEG